MRRLQAIHSLVQFARAVSDHGATDDPLRRLVDALVEHAGADAVAVFHVEPNGLKMAACRGLPDRFRSWTPEADDIGSDLGRAALAELGDDAFSQAKTLPLVSTGGLFGAAVLFWKQPDDGSEPWHDELAQGLADLAATALATSSHLQSLGRANEELRVSRNALVRSEKLRALGQMAAGVSHDLKNILSPLSLHLQLAARGNARGETDRVEEALGEMKQVLKRGLDVIDRLRQFSRQTPSDSKVVSVDLNALAHEATELAKPRMATGAGPLSRVHEEYGAPPAVLGEPSEIVSAVLNLLVNAIDAMPQGGNLTVRTGEERGGGWISIADDGPGMSAEVQARVFEPFFTTKGNEGTGLGLAMVYATLHRHRGTVHLDSEAGKGATFTLWFPPPP